MDMVLTPRLSVNSSFRFLFAYLIETKTHSSRLHLTPRTPPAPLLPAPHSRSVFHCRQLQPVQSTLRRVAPYLRPCLNATLRCGDALRWELREEIARKSFSFCRSHLFQAYARAGCHGIRTAIHASLVVSAD